MFVFLSNIVRINLKKLLQSPFQSLLVIAINFSLFFISDMRFGDGVFLSQSQFLFVFILISLANLLYIYNNIIQKIPAISLLRSMGASKVYVIFDFCIEILLLYIITAVLFAISLLFYKPFPDYLIYTAYEALWLIVISIIITLYALKIAEKREKGE